MTHRQSWQIPLLILLSLPLWQSFAASFLTIEQGAVSPPVRQDKSFTLEGVTFSQATKGIQDISLQAQRLHSTNDNNTVTLEKVNANRVGTNPLHIVSGSAVYDPDREVVTLLDGVLIEAADLIIKTPFLRYLIKYETIKSAGEVSISGDEMSLSGTSFMYNVNTAAMRVGKRVHFLYTPVQP
ncbi:MAG: LPS export ABC transporter periplasmic protein LptC [Proteobacteria bacterium]|nr:LPS export ABC transporter periplasmic protein LptC [Desulfobulbaceae bacterium]MBU4153527.1 LPS export ABC transporter periplasmic protein LptC [Pseudomonadota bacterium]